jgi:hypothetical protein
MFNQKTDQHSDEMSRASTTWIALIFENETSYNNRTPINAYGVHKYKAKSMASQRPNDATQRQTEDPVNSGTTVNSPK